MSTHTLTTRLHLPLPRDTVFPFFAKAENLGRITPPELAFRIRTPLPIAMRPGTLIDYTIGLHGIPMRWRTRITEWNPPHDFADEQLKGPYARWYHRHEFVEEHGGTTMTDVVEYRLPFGPLGDLAHWIVKRQLRRIFSYRQEVVWREFGLKGTPDYAIAFG